MFNDIYKQTLIFPIGKLLRRFIYPTIILHDLA